MIILRRRGIVACARAWAVHQILRRLKVLPDLAPEWAEVLTGATAAGWAWNFLFPGQFGPPGSTVAHIVDMFGAPLSAAWAFATAFFPLVSIALGRRCIRFASTLLCGLMWTAIIIVSCLGGTYFSVAILTSVICLIALFRSQVAIVTGRGLIFAHER